MLSCRVILFRSFFFFNDTATTEIYTLSLHDALPILDDQAAQALLSDKELRGTPAAWQRLVAGYEALPGSWRRSEEHTSELQSRLHLVCRLLLEKKKRPEHEELQRERSGEHGKRRRHF